MLTDILMDLRDAINAKDFKKQEKIFRDLERLGVDRITAAEMVKALTKYEKQTKRKPDTIEYWDNKHKAVVKA